MTIRPHWLERMLTWLWKGGHVVLLGAAGNFAADSDARYVENLRVPDLSLGTYSIPAGAQDRQQPHTEDEVYVVLS